MASFYEFFMIFSWLQSLQIFMPERLDVKLTTALNSSPIIERSAQVSSLNSLLGSILWLVHVMALYGKCSVNILYEMRASYK